MHHHSFSPSLCRHCQGATDALLFVFVVISYTSKLFLYRLFFVHKKIHEPQDPMSHLYTGKLSSLQRSCVPSFSVCWEKCQLNFFLAVNAVCSMLLCVCTVASCRLSLNQSWRIIAYLMISYGISWRYGKFINFVTLILWSSIKTTLYSFSAASVQILKYLLVVSWIILVLQVLNCTL